MPRKMRELKADPGRAGFEQVPTKSSHTRWRHPLLRGATPTLSGADGHDAKAYRQRDLRKVLARLRQLQERQP